MSAATSKKKSKKARKVNEGMVYIQSSYNNTLISITDLQGNLLVWSSAGRVGFSGAKKSTPYAAQLIVSDAVERLKPFGMTEIKVFVKGIGTARESAVRALASAGLTILSISDTTPIPHNGVRAPKKRRV